MPIETMTRRHVMQTIAGGLGAALLTTCKLKDKWHDIDVSGVSPALALEMTRASDGKRVTEMDYRGRAVLLYLGYTFCPDVCPTTLATLSEILSDLHEDAAHVSVLFVTVDPDRDTLPVLADYTRNFAPQIDGLRGTPDQLARLARRFRLVYSVTPATGNQPYDVTHSSAIYAFDGSGTARFLISSLVSQDPDIAGVRMDLRQLVALSKLS